MAGLGGRESRQLLVISHITFWDDTMGEDTGDSGPRMFFCYHSQRPAVVLASHSAIMPPPTPTLLILKSEENKVGMVAHAFNPSNQEAKAGRLKCVNTK